MTPGGQGYSCVKPQDTQKNREDTKECFSSEFCNAHRDEKETWDEHRVKE
jgi:hypothetical protein